MDEQPATEQPATKQQEEARPTVRRLALPRLRLPALRLPALRLPALSRQTWKRPRWRRPAFRRPSLPDVVFAAGTACLVLAIVVVMAAPSIGRLRARAHEAVVLGNAATIQLAAETYAAGHLGRYPADVAELLPYLPKGRAPRNPYTRKVVGFDGGVGDVTYRAPAGGREYLIEAWGPGTARPRLLAALRGRAAQPGE